MLSKVEPSTLLVHLTRPLPFQAFSLLSISRRLFHTRQAVFAQRRTASFNTRKGEVSTSVSCNRHRLGQIERPTGAPPLGYALSLSRSERGRGQGRAGSGRQASIRSQQEWLRHNWDGEEWHTPHVSPGDDPAEWRPER